MVLRADIAAFIGRQGEEHAPFDIILLDPPYADTDLRDRALTWLGMAAAPLAADGRVVVKHFWRDQPPGRVGLLASERARRFGETTLTFYRRQEDG
jgi:16S rRNA G966 N2-methylase RsmD